MASPD